MSRRSKYVLQRDDKAKCPRCLQTNVDLLAPDAAERLPMFYLCRTPDCGFVGQVGVGPVRRDDARKELASHVRAHDL